MAVCFPNSSAMQGTMNFRRGERKMQNVLWAAVDGILSETDLENFAALLQDWWNDTYRTFVCDDIVLDNVTVKQWSDNGMQEIVDCQLAANCNGNQSATPLPANLAPAISWSGGTRGRRNRGRTYVQTIPEGMVDDNDILTAALLTLMSAAAADYLGRFFPVDLLPVIFHCLDGTFTHIVDWRVDDLPDSQRRRLPGRGN